MPGGGPKTVIKQKSNGKVETVKICNIMNPGSQGYAVDFCYFESNAIFKKGKGVWS